MIRTHVIRYCKFASFNYS